MPGNGLLGPVAGSVQVSVARSAAREIRGPVVHEPTPPLEQVRTPARGLDLVLDEMRKSRLDDLPGKRWNLPSQWILCGRSPTLRSQPDLGHCGDERLGSRRASSVPWSTPLRLRGQRDGGVDPSGCRLLGLPAVVDVVAEEAVLIVVDAGASVRVIRCLDALD